MPMLIVAMVAMMTVGAACSSGGTHPQTASTKTTVTTGTTSSEPATTSSHPASTTTLGPPPAPGSIPFMPFAGTSPPDGVSPQGSGCTPQSRTTLPEGKWFGMLKAVDPAAGTIGFDLACIFVGDAANAAARADGATVVPVPNDHWIRNQSPLVYTLHAVPDVAVGVLGANGSAVEYHPTQQGLAAATPLVNGSWVWIEVTSGWVTAIQQQYIP